jgi:fumarylacetoacetate (FAA) hydrolase
METLQDGQPSTEYLKFGDTIRIEMKGRDGQTLFGAIEQEVVPANATNPARSSAAEQKL